MTTNTHTLGHDAVKNLRDAVAVSWFEPEKLLQRIDLWSGVLVDAFNLADSGDDDVELELPNGIGWDSAENILAAFDSWLGHDVIRQSYDLAGSKD